MEGVRCVRLGVTDVGESVKSGRVGDLKGSQKAPNWTSETGGADVDDGEDNLPQWPLLDMPFASEDPQGWPSACPTEP